METIILGNFIEDLPKTDSISISFFSYRYKKNEPLFWDNNGLSANFVASYFKAIYAARMNTDEIIMLNLYASIRYISNELFENAMKFQDYPVQHKITFKFFIFMDKLVFTTTNAINKKQFNHFHAYILKLLDIDQDELYIQKMRSSIQEKNKNKSGLGILSILCDYKASIGWKFFNLKNKNTTMVTTMVCLDLKTREQCNARN